MCETLSVGDDVALVDPVRYGADGFEITTAEGDTGTIESVESDGHYGVRLHKYENVVIEFSAERLRKSSAPITVPHKRFCAHLPDMKRLGKYLHLSREHMLHTAILLALASTFYLGWPDEMARAIRGPAMAYDIKTLEGNHDHVRPGEPLIVHASEKVLRLCSWTWYHKWQRLTDQGLITIGFTSTNGVPAPVANQQAEIDIKTPQPKTLEPGRYVLETTGVAKCDYGDISQTDSGPMVFVVEDNPPQVP